MHSALGRYSVHNSVNLLELTPLQLQAANWDAQRAGTGIVYIDEVGQVY